MDFYEFSKEKLGNTEREKEEQQRQLTNQPASQATSLPAHHDGEKILIIATAMSVDQPASWPPAHSSNDNNSNNNNNNKNKNKNNNNDEATWPDRPPANQPPSFPNIAFLL